MTVIARDAVASDHLVYAWPFPLGPECEVSCAEDEQVVMCPSWLVGDRLGPGHHRWRTPDPMRPVAAFFVLTSPVETLFDMTTSFLVPATGQPIRIRAQGAIQVRCADPGLLIAQFVGLPFDNVNDGILRSVSRSVERMLARLLTRRVIMAGTPYAVTDPSMIGSIVEELVAYNPTAGAVFGVELIRMGHLQIAADDGNAPYVAMPDLAASSQPGADGWHHHERAGSPPTAGAPNGELSRGSEPELAPIPPPPKEPKLVETMRGLRPQPGPQSHDNTPTTPPLIPKRNTPRLDELASASGEITVRPKTPTVPGLAVGTTPPGSPKVASSGASSGATAGVIEVRSREEITQPNMRTPAPGANASMRSYHTPESGAAPEIAAAAPRGGILGIGVGGIGGGASSVAGEIPAKVAPGARVLVPGPNGLMQSATVRQLLQGYYELEVGSSGETIWVPINGVVPE